MPEMILTFKSDGTVKKETKGFIGKECITKTSFMEDALGGTPKGRKFKDDYYKENENKERDRLQG